MAAERAAEAVLDRTVPDAREFTYEPVPGTCHDVFFVAVVRNRNDEPSEYVLEVYDPNGRRPIAAIAGP